MGNITIKREKDIIIANIWLWNRYEVYVQKLQNKMWWYYRTYDENTQLHRMDYEVTTQNKSKYIQKLFYRFTKRKI